MKRSAKPRVSRNYDTPLKVITVISIVLPFIATFWELAIEFNQYMWAPIVLAVLTVIFLVTMFMALRVPVRELPKPAGETNLNAARGGPSASSQREEMRAAPGEQTP